MSTQTTTTITQRDAITKASANYEIVIVDKNDTSSSSDGTDKKIQARDLLENTEVRPSTDQAVSRQVNEWVGEFRDKITNLESLTVEANTTTFGIVRFATAAQAQTKTAYDRALSAGVLSSMDATESLAGLLALANLNEVAEGQVGDKAITPLTLFQSILGEATFGNTESTFKLPVRDASGDVKAEILIQIGEETFNTMETGQNPTSNFNHIHQTVDVSVNFQQPFPNQLFIVIPVPFEVEPQLYTEATNFYIRPRSSNQSGATFRATRINGSAPAGRQAGVRYIAIGY